MRPSSVMCGAAALVLLAAGACSTAVDPAEVWAEPTAPVPAAWGAVDYVAFEDLVDASWFAGNVVIGAFTGQTETASALDLFPGSELARDLPEAARARTIHV